MMRFNLLPVHFKYTTLLYWIFMHLSVPTGITHQRTSTRDRTPRGDSPRLASPGQLRWCARDWQQGCAGTGLPRNSNPLLGEGRSQQSLLRPHLPCCPGFQLQARLCPKLQRKGRHWRKPLLLQRPGCPSPPPALHRSLGSQFHTDLGVQLAGSRLPTHITHHPLHSTVIKS